MVAQLYRQARDSYASVRAQTPLYAIEDSTLVAWIFSARFSPIFTAIFIRYGVRPNSVTILMILSGLLGAALFAVDNVFVKLAGYVFIQLWFVMDCSDGEIARITRDFSDYGTEIDYLAHVLTHPAFQVSFLLSAVQLYIERGMDLRVLLVVFAAIAVVELMIRAMLGLELICRYKDAKNGQAGGPVPKQTPKQMLVSAIYVYPNVALFFPIIYFLDVLLGTTLGFYYTVFVLVVSAPMMAKLALSVVGRLARYPT